MELYLFINYLTIALCLLIIIRQQNIIKKLKDGRKRTKYPNRIERTKVG